MIVSFRDRHTQDLYEGKRVKALPSDILKRAVRKLAMIDTVTRLEDLRVPPGNMLEALSGDRVGQYSIRVNDQWRICFEWHDGDAYDVELVDYHS
jgi:proteic killer suppression protein